MQSVKRYWAKIVSEMSNILDKELVLDSLFLVLGLPWSGKNIGYY